MRRNGFPNVSKHTVDRFKRQAGRSGLVRGQCTRTTVPGRGGRLAGDLLSCFPRRVPNHSWVTDFTCVPTWSGFAYAALVIDLNSRAVGGWLRDHTGPLPRAKETLRN